MFKRKLQALNHPGFEKVNVEVPSEFKSVIVWLEDTKICFYKIDQREPLRATNDDAAWKVSFNKYCSDIGCPKLLESDLEKLTWLLSYAVRIKYAEDVDKYKEHSADKIKTKSSAPSIKSNNPFDKLNFDSPEFKRGVSDLAALAGIPVHDDHLVTVQALKVFVTERLAADKINIKPPQGTPFPFEDGTGLGFADPVVEQAAKILRLLHIQELRRIQTGINETIVAVQTLTANPKTDTALGKVGF